MLQDHLNSKKKKIVIISRTIFPIQKPRALRATELAKEFARKGHKVILYSVLGDFDYSEFERDYKLKVRNLGPLQFSTYTSSGRSPLPVWLKILTKVLKKPLDFPDIELAFKVPKVIKQEPDTDALVTVAVPYAIHWGAAISKYFRPSKFPKSWIADCGDPYMGNKFNNHYWYFKYLEKFFSRRADYITIPIENARSAYYKEFHEKIEVIPQGFDFSDQNIGEHSVINDIPTFAYAGSFYKGIRDPSGFLDYLKNIETDFRFVLYTQDIELLEPYVEELGTRMEIRNYVPRNDLLKSLATMDFVINFENGTEVQSPSKLIDYALLDKPILSVAASGIDTNKIDAFLCGDYSGRLVINNIEDYDIRNVAEKFLDLMEK